MFLPRARISLTLITSTIVPSGVIRSDGTNNLRRWFTLQFVDGCSQPHGPFRADQGTAAKLNCMSCGVRTSRRNERLGHLRVRVVCSLRLRWRVMSWVNWLKHRTPISIRANREFTVSPLAESTN
ncbi:uncharacterized protein EI90DRAFT_2421817 [Cantharellus anzutake]|uniref:uncharacterized protein n=1 Tax=Cantharellus anzutake TaxID=1750568 RepID=UPI001906BEF3|nr:uncharacterized protein EI90DRAFT_2421817 [Cantharellus anzutake]KAF8338859.1 hypothetical protein EI90DRAFT_2421817 [Cantharellus anzutake]